MKDIGTEDIQVRIVFEKAQLFSIWGKETGAFAKKVYLFASPHV
jgi:hypothetical protein